MVVTSQMILWIILSCIILAFPARGLSVRILRQIKKIFSLARKQIDEVKTLDALRRDFLKQTAEETEKIDVIREDEISPHTSSPAHEEHQAQPHNHNEKPSPKIQKQIEKITYEALLLKERGQLEEYEKKIIEGLALWPYHEELNRMLADLYFHTGNYNKALTLLKKIVEHHPEDHKALWQIGEIYLQKGEFETAVLLIEKAIELKPNNPKYYVSLVEIKYNQKEVDDAINLMEKVIKLRPTNVDYMSALAKLYEENSDLDNARKYYYKVLEIEPTNERAKVKLKNLHISQG